MAMESSNHRIIISTNMINSWYLSKSMGTLNIEIKHRTNM